jgi:hypothetical protein
LSLLRMIHVRSSWLAPASLYGPMHGPAVASQGSNDCHRHGSGSD